MMGAWRSGSVPVSKTDGVGSIPTAPAMPGKTLAIIEQIRSLDENYCAIFDKKHLRVRVTKLNGGRFWIEQDPVYTEVDSAEDAERFVMELHGILDSTKS